mgnify:CR=1 FL=1
MYSKNEVHSSMNKRLGIFYFSDLEGISDEYVSFLIKNMSKYLSHLTAIIDTNSEKEIYCLIDGCDEIVYGKGREKSYATVLLRYLKNESFDEIVLFDDTVFGPFNSMDPIFKYMDLKDVNFWGLYRQASYVEEGEIVDSYLSPFFFVLKKSLYKSEEFKDFLNQVILERMPMIKWTSLLEKLGFKSLAYYEFEDFIYPNPEQNYDIIRYRLYDLIVTKKFPFLPKKKFTDNNDWNPDLANTLIYLNEQTQYDVNLIWRNVLRTCDINQIRKNTQLIYTVPDNISHGELPVGKKIAVIIHFYYLDCFIAADHYLRNIPFGIDLYITTSNEEIVEHVKKSKVKLSCTLQVKLVKNRGRDVSALLVGCRDLVDKYDYFCFVHDKKTSSIQSATVWELFNFNMWENNLKSEDYIYNVIELFEKNPRLGLLVPPIPKHANYINLLIDGWRQCYELLENLLNDLHIDIPISRESQPFAFSTTFWCRAEALKPLFNRNYKYEDFPEEPLPATGTISHAIERSFPYIAQAAGFFSGTVESAFYAELELISYEFNVSNMILENEKLKQYNAQLKEQIDFFGERNVELKNDNDEYGRYNVKLKNENDILNEYIKKVKTENNLLNEYIKKVKAEDNLLRENIKKVKAEDSLLRENNKGLKEKNEALAKRNKELKIRVNEFGEYNKKLKEEIKRYC